MENKENLKKVNNLSLKVNVIQQFNLLRNSTFKDPLCFIDENIQNAQRAKSKVCKVQTDYYGKTITFENDGEILNDASVLFHMAESGWNEEVTERENPFGVGFFSNISISDFIEIYSGNKYVVFDVQKIIRDRDINSIEEYQVDEFYDGFKLVLNNVDFDKISTSGINERLKLLGQYIHEISIYNNGNLCEKKNLLETDGSKFAKVIDSETIKGWIAFCQYSWNSGVNIFHRGRFVEKLEISMLKGDLHIFDSRGLNLTAPDRKNIIRDGKYEEFIKFVNKNANEICLDILATDDEGIIEEYSEALNRYADVNSLDININFLVYNGRNDKKLIEEIIKIKKEKYPSTFSELKKYLSNERQNEKEKEIVIQNETLNKVYPEDENYEDDDSIEETTTRRSRRHTEEEKIKERCSNVSVEIKPKEKEEDIFEKTKFWVSFNDITYYSKYISILSKYNINIIFSKNVFEDKILRNLQSKNKIFHIDSLDKEVKTNLLLSKTTLNKKEQRAFSILGMISRMAGFEENVFRIGNLKVVRKFEVKNTNDETILLNEDIIDDCQATYSASDKKIYINRKTIDFSKLPSNSPKNLTINDIKFVINNIKTITEDLSLMVDKNRYELAIELSQKILG